VKSVNQNNTKARSLTRTSSAASLSGGLTLQREVLVCAAVFTLALSVRLYYLFQIESFPLFYHLASDARGYDEWARRIAAGDWMGREVFYQAPLYPYFLAVLQVLFGHNLWAIRVVQMILGALSCVLIYQAGMAFFSRRAGIAAGLILALYAPAIFSDALIQKSILDLFFIAILLFFLGRTRQTPHWLYWAIIGSVLACLGLSRENALVWAVVVPIWIWLFFSERSSRTRLAWIAVFFAGLMLVLLPVGLRNYRVGGEFTLTTSQFGPNFFIGNNPKAEGVYLPLRPGRGDPLFERQDATELAQQALQRRLSPGAVSGYWLGQAFEYIRTQPFDWLWLMGRKWLLVWNVREIEDADDFYLYQRWSRWLSILAWASHFGVLAPLAAVGFLLTWRQWRGLSLLYLLLATMAFSVVLFVVSGRYRLPMIPLLTLFAGTGLVETIALCRERRVRHGLACVAILSLSAAVVNWPLTGKLRPSATSYNNLSNVLAQQGRIDEAIKSLEQALEIRPNYYLTHYNLGNLFASRGELDEARQHFEEALKNSPDYAAAYNNLAIVLARQGQVTQAVQHFRKALELGLVEGEIYVNLAMALVSGGRQDEAIGYLKQALKLQPDHAEAHQILGRLQASRGELDQAIVHFRHALRLKPDSADVHESLARALALSGKRDEAVQHYQEAVRIVKSRQSDISR